MRDGPQTSWSNRSEFSKTLAQIIENGDHRQNTAITTELVLAGILILTEIDQPTSRPCKFVEKSWPHAGQKTKALWLAVFFLATIVQATVCIVLAVVLATTLEAPAPSKHLRLPVAFKFGTVFLAIGSWFLHRSLAFVQRERQAEFRRALILALMFAVLFVSIQSYGLWGFIHSTQDHQAPQMNTHGFVFVFASLHAMHFLVAQSVLLWVTLAAHFDRYDHEYYFGITFATWLWHVLGIAWLAILWVFSIAA